MLKRFGLIKKNIIFGEQFTKIEKLKNASAGSMNITFKIIACQRTIIATLK